MVKSRSCSSGDLGLPSPQWGKGTESAWTALGPVEETDGKRGQEKWQNGIPVAQYFTATFRSKILIDSTFPTEDKERYSNWRKIPASNKKAPKGKSSLPRGVICLPASNIMAFFFDFCSYYWDCEPI